MPRYFFNIHWPDKEHADVEGIVLAADSDALDYARQIIRELRSAGDYESTALFMVVTDDANRTLYSIPFLAH
jgi:hypothetical protein